MQINQDIIEVLKEFKIDKNKGLLALLAIYYQLDPENTIPEDTIQAINLTKIVEKNHINNSIIWNMPLFEGQQTEWDWVKTEYNEMWRNYQSRKDSNTDCTKRMQEFFKRYPVYRKGDVIQATRNYMKTVSSEQYAKRSALFIFDGKGAMKTSMLAGWCEKLAAGSNVSQMRGTITK